MKHEKHSEPPYSAYAKIIGVFVAVGAGSATIAQRRHSFTLADLALLGLSTSKITNIIATDRVTSVVRAPFTEQSEREGKIEEEPKGRGHVRALGELLTCQYCLGPWVASALVSGHAIAPRWTRGILGLFAVVAISDLLHHVNDYFESDDDRQ